MTQFEKMQALLKEMGLEFELSDDSQESKLDEDIDTVIVVNDNHLRAYFFFTRAGAFRELNII